MTRINLGIAPYELCDQHLLAEYRELPRMRAFAMKRLAKYGGPGPRPEHFTLGTGHMAFFLPYGLSLEYRWRCLKREMEFRGFRPALNWPDGYPFMDAVPPIAEVRAARPLLQAGR